MYEKVFKDASIWRGYGNTVLYTVLGTLISVAGTDDVASAYAATYPVALVIVVLSAKFLVTLLI